MSPSRILLLGDLIFLGAVVLCVQELSGVFDEIAAAKPLLSYHPGVVWTLLVGLPLVRYPAVWIVAMKGSDARGAINSAFFGSLALFVGGLCGLYLLVDGRITAAGYRPCAINEHIKSTRLHYWEREPGFCPEANSGM